MKYEQWEALANHLAGRKNDWPNNPEWRGFLKLFRPWWQLKYISWERAAWWSENERRAFEQRTEELEQLMKERYPRRYSHLQLALRTRPYERHHAQRVVAQLLFMGLVMP